MNRPLLIAAGGAGLVALLILGAFAFSAGDGASASKSDIVAAVGDTRGPAMISSTEANAWAEARAADNKGAYEVYLAAFPDGAFADDAREALVGAAEKSAARSAQAAPRRVSGSGRRTNVAAACRAYVDRTLSQPSRVGRTVGGAAAGCAVGAMAGGDDGRNCAVGAVTGGVAGAVSAESRERRRMQEVQYCIANGGPPR